MAVCPPACAVGLPSGVKKAMELGLTVPSGSLLRMFGVFLGPRSFDFGWSAGYDLGRWLGKRPF